MYLDKKSSVIILAVVVTFVVAMYLTYNPDTCSTFECFQKHMTRCSPATYINEEPDASWQYTVRGVEGSMCSVDVTLLQAKKGDIIVKDFEGHSMTCSYEKGVSAYPEKDLSLCHGTLKEDLQGTIIKKLHQYILDNLGTIQQEISNLV